MFIDAKDPRAEAVTAAIRAGDVIVLTSHLAAHPELVAARIGTQSEARTLLHILADHPGHVPNGPAIAQTLVAAGANVNAPFIGVHSETPLHWAASNDDVALLDTLLDAGADINADGGVIADTPLADARAFLQLNTARRLVERGAAVTLQDAATLGLKGRVEAFYRTGQTLPLAADTDQAFWNACHGGQLAIAELLREQGAALNIVPPWEKLTPLDAAERSNASDVVSWLNELGAKKVTRAD